MISVSTVVKIKISLTTFLSLVIIFLKLGYPYKLIKRSAYAVLISSVGRKTYQSLLNSSFEMKTVIRELWSLSFENSDG